MNKNGGERRKRNGEGAKEWRGGRKGKRHQPDEWVTKAHEREIVAEKRENKNQKKDV